jgi:dienelactone hydrolase
LIRYATEPDEEVDAWLLLPTDEAARPTRGWPAAVVFHSTTDQTIDEPAGTDPADAVAIGTWLCQRGFVVLCPRCHLWNTTPAHRLDLPGAVARLAARHPGARGMRKLLHDGIRAVVILQSIDDVDPTAIVAAGHSLGAKEALYLAAFDDRVTGAVFSEGGIGLSFSNWHDPWYLGDAIRDPAFRLDHAQLLALTLPRGMLILGGEAGPGAADGDRSWGHVARALEVGRLERPRPRLGLFNHRGGHAIPPAARERLLDWLGGCAGGAGG